MTNPASPSPPSLLATLSSEFRLKGVLIFGEHPRFQALLERYE